ncbi:2-oxo-4-hydroxy-4-carboxy-5-ureidoimidazoline decarboxylase [Shewanella psychropiezotolerans]|uniref:2-oxo-4-hydroxy-4-carboxy-5-ureidoimidazoline decarboxylase n=1 Tax=Shewanella psychropiezotolerans TaxID=2593655 RepID=A0ABX5WXQ6_9GAMM|nr:MULTISPECIES: 2-oxo-4-hydroxy-4-carboxy-5-ureidoimidazoline decarboxylase [Shewanella]MPY22465.1 2-oxo-4-hydroxy-4-carboxy-5-ureidoimidazoline decarboxylase [Shewanella sp. YLB-07]QDO83222.1 2-oxo-4-hydroxy-4-carboxy-5-ureidoimidazoline decarboxylase [Shewanella psychropiezotolerans]
MMHFSHCQPTKMNRSEFVAHFKDVYEHSPWVAEWVFDAGFSGNEDDINIMHQRMADTLLQADKSKQLALINAHPDLAGRAAINGELTQASTSEQAGAGIDLCSAEEFERFTRFNQLYLNRFNFPFIKAVKGANRHQILESFEMRLDNDSETEFSTALAEINKIALFRLQDM